MTQIQLYFLFKALHGAVFVVPILVAYWRLHGLTLFEVMSLQTLFALTLALLEVPSGVLADRVGRKKALIASSSILAFASLLYLLASDYFGFLTAELTFAVGVSLFSGIESAWLFEHLSKLGRASEYSKVYGRSTSVFLVSLAMSNVVGGYLAAVNMVYPFYGMLISFSLLVPVSCFFEETAQRSGSSSSVSNDLKSVLRTVRQDSCLLWLVAYSTLLLCASQVAFWLYQPLFEVRGVQLQHFGWIYASFNLVAAVAASQIDELQRRLSFTSTLLLLWLVMLIGGYLLGSVETDWCFAFAYLQQLVRGTYRTVVSNAIQARVSNEQRASILSLQGLIGFFAQSAATLLAGYSADIFGVVITLKLISIVGFFGGCVLFYLKTRGKQVLALNW